MPRTVTKIAAKIAAAIEVKPPLAHIQVIADTPTSDLDRFASERSIRLEWTLDPAFVELCEKHGFARRGVTAWSTSGEDDNQNNIIRFVRKAIKMYGPHIVQGRGFNAAAPYPSSWELQRSLTRAICNGYHTHDFDYAQWPAYHTPESNLRARDLARIVVNCERGAIWFRLQTGHLNESEEFDALTYPRMHGLTPEMRRTSFLTPLEASDAISMWESNERAEVHMAADVRAAMAKINKGIVVGYKTGAPALAVIRAGDKVKNPPTPKNDKSISLKRIAGMQKRNPKLKFYVHPSLHDIIAMNNAKPHPDERLREYQQEAVGLHLATNTGYLQACDTGGGKTVMQLVAMHERSKTIKNYRGLIVCEAGLRNQWQEETEVWFPGAQFVFVKTAKDASKVADILATEGPAVVVTSYTHAVSALKESERREILLAGGPEADALVDDDLELEDISLGAMLLDTRWHDACADEAVCVRNNSSMQSRALWALRSNIDVATALTATPRNKSHDDIGHLLAWVRNDKYLFAGDTKLSLCYDETNEKDAKRLYDTLGPLVFRRDQSEFADELPTPNHIVEYLTPTPAEKMLAHSAETELKRIYFELLEALRHAEKAQGADAEELKDARKALREAHGAWLGGTTLARMTMSDPVSILGSKSVGAKLLIAQGLVQAAIDSNPSKRAKFLEDVAARVANGEQVLVFTSYATVANLLVEHLENIGISAAPFTGKNQSSRDKHRIDFQAGNIDVLVATSAGTRGLTLTAATTVIHYDLPWTIEQVIQRTGRIIRFGSVHENVDVVFYVLEGTIEERIALHLAENGRAASLVLDVARGASKEGSGTAHALGGLLTGRVKPKLDKNGKPIAPKKFKNNAQGAVEFGKVLLGV